MLLLSLSAFGVNDVSVRFNGGGGDNKVYVGETNIFEMLLSNDAALLGMTLGFCFSSVNGDPFSWDSPYGNKPDFGAKYVQEHNDAVNKFDLGGLNVNSSALPSSVLIGGAAIGAPLPANGAGRLCYSMSLQYPAGADQVGGFCVDNCFFPPAGSWTYTPGGAPTYQGNPNPGGELNPDAPAVCFDVLTRPCVDPAFTSVPGLAVNKNHCSPYTFDFDADPNPPPGNNPPATLGAFTTSVGVINPNTGELSVPAVATCGTTDVTVSVTNSCGGSADYSFTITWTNNNPSITNCPVTSAKVAMGNAYNLDLNSSDPDPCDGASWGVLQTGGNPTVGAFGISGLGVFTFNTVNGSYPAGDGGETYQFTATVTDPCGGTAQCVFSVEVLETAPFIIQIEKTHNTIQGHFEMVDIIKVDGSEAMGGFDFLIGYDASALSFYSAELGAALGPAGCGWEYFTYRYGAFGNCGGPCPSGKLRVVAIADMNNGPNHPSCFTVANGAALVTLKFLVTNDRTFECMYVPIRFCWLDCGDNGISSVSGDTLFISSQVFEYQNTNPLTDPNFEITGLDCGWAFHWGGACAECDVSDKYAPVRFIIFWNGGIDIVCADSIDDRGDINLNGIENEIADAVLYTNYFLYGILALDSNPLYREAQIAASDVNNDGIPLTVGDLVYLVRIILGDALPFPKLAPFANDANINVVNGLVSTEAASEIGGLVMTFAVNGSYNVISHTDMEVLSAESNGELKVLVYSGTQNLSNRISAGTNDLFTVTGNVELKNVEVSDYNGSMLNARVSKTALPTSFALKQNVPNPFNPTTKIGLDLPTASDWSIDIYNVAGQLVRTFSGRGVGSISVDVNANELASGIYFYKATAGAFTDTKKMVLMK
jgi:hypothetical protein